MLVPIPRTSSCGLMSSDVSLFSESVDFQACVQHTIVHSLNDEYTSLVFPQPEWCDMAVKGTKWAKVNFAI